MNKNKLNDKHLDDLIEEATVDCYSNYESLMGFNTYLDDNLEFPFPAEVIGEKIIIIGLSFDDGQIKVICKKQGKKYKINILNIKYNPKEVKNYQWIEAYKKWFGEIYKN